MNDLISRKQAIDTLTRLEPSFRGSVLEQALKNMPPAQTESHWTPCNVALPSKKGVYIVTGRNGTVSRFIFSDTDASKKYWLRAVLARMPMPKPYKGAKND